MNNSKKNERTIKQCLNTVYQAGGYVFKVVIYLHFRKQENAFFGDQFLWIMYFFLQLDFKALKEHGQDFCQFLNFYFYSLHCFSYEFLMINQNSSRRIKCKRQSHVSVFCKQRTCHIVFLKHCFNILAIFSSFSS